MARRDVSRRRRRGGGVSDAPRIRSDSLLFGAVLRQRLPVGGVDSIKVRSLLSIHAISFEGDLFPNTSQLENHWGRTKIVKHSGTVSDSNFCSVACLEYRAHALPIIE